MFTSDFHLCTSTFADLLTGLFKIMQEPKSIFVLFVIGIHQQIKRYVFFMP